jgi:hypothetical protein
LFSPARGEKEGKKMILTATLTLIISHWERKGKKVKKISSRASSPLTGEDRGGGEKINNTPRFCALPQGREKIKRILFNQKRLFCLN